MAARAHAPAAGRAYRRCGMKRWQKAIALLLAQVAIVSSLGAKLLIDRSRFPRVWARVVPYDPDLPIRGRYLALRLEVQASPRPDDYSHSQWLDSSTTPPTQRQYDTPN